MFVFMGMRAGCISQTVKNFKPGEADHNVIFRSPSGPNSVAKLVAFSVLDEFQILSSATFLQSAMSNKRSCLSNRRRKYVSASLFALMIVCSARLLQKGSE